MYWFACLITSLSHATLAFSIMFDSQRCLLRPQAHRHISNLYPINIRISNRPNSDPIISSPMLLFPGYMFMFQIRSVTTERKQTGARPIRLFFTPCGVNPARWSDFRTAANGNTETYRNGIFTSIYFKSCQIRSLHFHFAISKQSIPPSLKWLPVL